MGKNINETDNKKIIPYGKYITYSVLLRLCLPKVHPVPFVSNLISFPKVMQLLMISQRSNSYQRHCPRSSFNSKTRWLPY